MNESEDPVAVLENISIDCHSTEVQNYKLSLIGKIENMEKLLLMYKFKQKSFHEKLNMSLQMETIKWLKPQIELTEQLINDSKRLKQQCDESSFNSSNILDFLENLHAFREEQKRINAIDIGTNPMGPMTTIQIELIHLTNKLLSTLKIVDLPNEEQLPTPVK